MDLLLWIGMCALAAMGLVQLIGWLACTFTRSSGCGSGYYVFLLPTDPATLEQFLRHRLLCWRWSGISDGYIILLDPGLDDECRAICQRLLAKEPGVFVCSPEEFAGTVGQFHHLQTEC